MLGSASAFNDTLYFARSSDRFRLGISKDISIANMRRSIRTGASSPYRPRDVRAPSLVSIPHRLVVFSLHELTDGPCARGDAPSIQQGHPFNAMRSAEIFARTSHMLFVAVAPFAPIPGTILHTTSPTEVVVLLDRPTVSFTRVEDEFELLSLRSVSEQSKPRFSYAAGERD